MKTYNVLLVDDELIILSGLKFLIDWEGISCNIVGTAHNGGEALTLIESVKPDIVICDINMPVYDGVQVLQKTYNMNKNIVFIMLTNHQEFHLAQQSLKYQAIDYILKTDLKPEILRNCLETAKKEWDRRQLIHKVDLVEQYIQENESQLIKDSFYSLFYKDNVNKGHVYEHDAVTFQSFRIITFYISFENITTISSFTDSEKQNLLQCQVDIISRISNNYFEHSTIIYQHLNKVVLFINNAENYDDQLIKAYYRKIKSVSQNMVETVIHCSITPVYYGEEQVTKCREDIACQDNAYFYLPTAFSTEIDHTMICQSNGIHNALLMNDITKAIFSKDPEQVHHILMGFIQYVEKEHISKEQVINGFITLYNHIIITLQSLENSQAFDQVFHNYEKSLQDINTYNSLEELSQGSDTLCQRLTTFYQVAQDTGNTLIQDAKNYIGKNLDKKITLKSAATHLNITPSYLSSLFKKECQRNFIDYVNGVKIDKSCDLLRENKYLIYEIAYILGFDNPYYFTKIFKKYKGCTPKEYVQHKSN